MDFVRRKLSRKPLEAKPSWRLQSGNPALAAIGGDAAPDAATDSKALADLEALTSPVAGIAAVEIDSDDDGKGDDAGAAATGGGGGAGAGAGAGAGGGVDTVGAMHGAPLRHPRASRLAKSRASQLSWRRGEGNPLMHAIPAHDPALDRGRARTSSGGSALDEGAEAEAEAAGEAGGAAALDDTTAREMTLWRTAVDGKTGKVYYYNIRTEETAWDLSEIPVWGKARDRGSGRTYYFNTRTGLRSFDRPDDYESEGDDGAGDGGVAAAAGAANGAGGIARRPSEPAEGKVVEW